MGSHPAADSIVAPDTVHDVDAARPASRRISTTTLRTEGHHGPTRNDLVDALRQTDTTQSFLTGLREIVRPRHDHDIITSPMRARSYVSN